MSPNINPLFPSPSGRRCPAGTDEGVGDRAYSDALTPSPLPGGEGLAARVLVKRSAEPSRLLPSPSGRRCPAGTDEGVGAGAYSDALTPAGFAPLASLSPDGEGLAARVLVKRSVEPSHLFPSPSGRRCPAGTDEGVGDRAHPDALTPSGFAPLASLSPGGEGSAARVLVKRSAEPSRLFPSPSGRRCPAGMDEGVADRAHPDALTPAGFAPLASLSPGGEGLAARVLVKRSAEPSRLFPSPSGRRCPAGTDEGVGDRAHPITDCP